MPVGCRGFQKGNTYGATNKRNPEALRRMSIERTGEGNPMWKGGKNIVSICMVCTKEILDRKTRKCCGRKCSAKYIGSINREKMRGKVSTCAHNWQGGKLNKQNYRNTKKYYWWKKRVFRLNGRKCGACGTTERLEVDHIKPLSQILFENKIKTLEEFYDCTEVWLISNGRVLCKECHKKHQAPWKGMKKIKLALATSF